MTALADRFVVDASEMQRLSVDLGKAAARLFPETVKVLEHGAVNISEEMKDDAEKSPSFRRISGSIGYDRADRLGQIGFEIGPETSRGGAAGGAAHLAGAYYGWPNGGGATLPLDAPLDHEAPKIEKAVNDLLGGLL